MFTTVVLILMLYFFYFGFNIYYDLFHRPKLDRDPNYFVQYEIDKLETNQREEVLKQDFAGILKPNSPRLSKSPTAPLSDPRTSSHSLLGKTLSSQIKNLNPSKVGRFSRWRVESNRKKAEAKSALEENATLLVEEPQTPLDKLARKKMQDAVSMRVFENINRSRRGAKKYGNESEPREKPTSLLQPQAVDKGIDSIVERKAEDQAKVPKKASAEERKNSPSHQVISVSQQDPKLHDSPVGPTEKPVEKSEKLEDQSTKAKWRQLMNLAETSIVVERVDGIKVYKSTLFDSNAEVELE